MDQKFRTAGGYFVTYILLSCGIGMLGLGIAMLSDPDKVARQIAFLMLLSSALFLYSGVTNLISTRKAAKKANRELEQVDKLIHQSTASAALSDRSSAIEEVSNKNEDKPNILAHWTYTQQEWNQFMGWEKKQRKSGHFVEAAGILIFGMVLLMYFKGEGFLVAFSISAFVAGIYWLGKYKLSLKSIGEVKRKGEIVITETAVIINGKYNSFKDEIYWLQKVSVYEEVKPEVLIIEYGWPTRNGNTFEEIRIPIPPGKLNEAKNVQWKLRSQLNNILSPEVSDTTKA